MKNDVWLYVLFAVVVLAICAYGIVCGKVKEWLKWAVAEAEQYLGSGTGQLKLHYVYDMFISQYPVLSKIIPFDVFSEWVDLALERLNEQLSKNTQIKAVIEGNE